MISEISGASASSFARLGSDAVVEIVPGRDHSSLMDSKLRERIAREMAAQSRRSQQQSQSRPLSSPTGE